MSGAGTPIGILRSNPLRTSHVRQIAVPPEARALSTLSHVDYADAFLVDVGRVKERTAEQWAREIFDAAPTKTRRSLYWAWCALGLRLGPARSDRFVLGFEVRRATSDFVLLGAGSRVGMPAELLVKRRDRTLLFDTFVEHDNPIARAVWASIEVGHVAAAKSVLEQAARRATDSSHG